MWRHGLEMMVRSRVAVVALDGEFTAPVALSAAAQAPAAATTAAPVNASDSPPPPPPPHKPQPSPMSLVATKHGWCRQCHHLQLVDIFSAGFAGDHHVLGLNTYFCS